MKSFIPHKLIVINDQIMSFINEKTLFRCCQIAFDWANTMGISGKKVFGLYLQKSDFYNEQSALWCQIECTEEERKAWERTQEINIENAVINALEYHENE